jgi:predicted ABC-type ATPase
VSSITGAGRGPSHLPLKGEGDGHPFEIAGGPAASGLRGRAFTQRLDAAVSRGESLLVESTLSGVGIGRLIRRARAAGYRISLEFVFVDSAEVCIWRIRTRVQKGGHGVADPDIRRRFPRSVTNFWERYRFDADAWYLTYNGGGSAIRVAFGNGSRAVVVDRGGFERFLGLLEA